jgi:hypothetical protein
LVGWSARPTRREVEEVREGGRLRLISFSLARS